MAETQIDRRLLLGGVALAGAVIASPAASAQPAPAAAFAPQPLPFDPKAVPGLSEKLLTSHHDNNYTGAVKRLSAIRAEFGKLDPATAPNFEINGLKREELVAWNSMVLHEVYFNALRPAESISAPLAQMLERDFGSQDRWAAEFAGIGKALGGGSGWVLLTYSRHDGRLVNTWAADHTMVMADGAPLLALDMYEHAYHMDYGAKAGDYVNAYMKAFSWHHPNNAFRRASAA
ncbi:Fe-Mn family superoxide dismutase [Phenylobacterium sp.]|uniref:superoxide dismutase n=1 Tax=Phenylobacterium sp. TaxID=1871053 RepID=UPI0025D1A5C1|nr:Fe-Mn family superoxide dismutase [Phenylobacterium sp.]